MGELHAEVVLGDVHEGVRRRHDAHAVVAPQDIHHKAIPECRPHLRTHTDCWPAASMTSAAQTSLETEVHCPKNFFLTRLT